MCSKKAMKYENKELKEMKEFKEDAQEMVKVANKLIKGQKQEIKMMKKHHAKKR
jgi:F0F1-type ATP synthase membrane subunit b/b'